jgi:hypothetical protein
LCVLATPTEAHSAPLKPCRLIFKFQTSLNGQHCSSTSEGETRKAFPMILGP